MNRISDINVIGIAKGDERFIFIYTHDARSDALRTMGRWASNQDLSFSWYDAAVLSKRVREEANSVRDFEEWMGA